MKTLLELRNRLKEIVREMDEIDKADTLASKNYLENQRYKELQTESAQVEADITASEAVEADRAKRQERSTKLKGSTGSPGLEGNPPAAKVNDNAADKPFRSFGEFLQCVRDAAVSISRGVALDPRMQKRAALGLNEGTGAEGGFLVGKDESAEILQEMHDVGVLAPLCQEIPISSSANAITFNGVDETSRVAGSRWGGVQAYWASEAGSTTATKPKFRQITLKLGKLFAVYYATDEVIADATALGRLASGAFAEEIAFQVDDAIVRGDGAGKPLGILNAPVLVTVAKESSQAADTVMYENIVKMYSRMPSRSMPRAKWFINQDILPQLLFMTVKVKNVAGTENVGGAPVYVPPGGASQQPFGTLLGRPIVPIEHAATLGDVGDIIFADFSQFMLATKGGLQQAESMHVQFLTGEMTYRFTYRCDGQPARKSALTPFKGSNTLSPFVVLAERA